MALIAFAVVHFLLLVVTFASPLAVVGGSDDQRHFAATAAPARPGSTGVDVDKVGWYDPRDLGGSLLNRVYDDLGEPLNIIISARSSPDILRKNGFIAYSRSLGLWNECANQHLGDPQFANLGDGNGWSEQLFVMRESIWWPWIGSCLESVVGGNHFRAWKQNGDDHNSGAWFLSASKEVDVRGNHMIVEDGYNIGRDLIVQKAVQGTTYLGRSWTTEVTYVEGLLKPGSEGVNHDIAQDGRVAVFVVTEY